jgi:hypothetical protein
VGCSEVVVEIPDGSDVIYVGFGEDSRLEVTADGDGWRDPRFRTHLDQVEAVADAVASGRLVETTWCRGEHILRSRGTLELADGPFEVTARHTLLPTWGSARKTRRYRRYCDDSAKEGDGGG